VNKTSLLLIVSGVEALISGGGGPKKGLFDFECLAPVLVRLVRDI